MAILRRKTSNAWVDRKMVHTCTIIRAIVEDQQSSRYGHRAVTWPTSGANVLDEQHCYFTELSRKQREEMGYQNALHIIAVLFIPYHRAPAWMANPYIGYQLKIRNIQQKKYPHHAITGIDYLVDDIVNPQFLNYYYRLSLKSGVAHG